jgi:fucose permease
MATLSGSFKPSATSAAREGGQRDRTSFAIVTSLFFVWGFITCMNDLLIPKFKAAFELSMSMKKAITAWAWAAALPTRPNAVTHLPAKRSTFIVAFVALLACHAAAQNPTVRLSACFVILSQASPWRVPMNHHRHRMSSSILPKKPMFFCQ